MIHYLSVLQFPFLFMGHFFIGLAIYGSDFERPSGKIYLLLLFLVPFILFLYRYQKVKNVIAVSLKPLQIVSILSGLYLYSLLHLNYWDEHSTVQAVLVLLLALGSLFTALISLSKIKSNLERFFWPMLLVATVYLANALYPLIAFMVISFILLSHFLSATIYTDNNESKQKTLPFYSAVILWFLFVESFMPIWDFQEVLLWPYLSFSYFIGFALSLFFGRFYQSFFNETTFQCLAVIAILFSVIFPSWVLNYSHTVVFGLLTGLFWVVFSKSISIKNLLLSVMSTWLWAGFISLVLYLNITIIEYRLVLLAVFVVPFVQYIKLKKVNDRN